jgi:tRNA-specific 2-thiouridylase
VDQEGRVIGRHQGLFGYTVGQRRGLGLPAKRPYYVLALDGIDNRLIVGPKEALFKEEALVRAVRWLTDPKELPQEGVEVQVRYRARPVPAKISLEKDKEVRVLFREPQRAVAPGQLAAFYSGERVLGGGWLA